MIEVMKEGAGTPTCWERRAPSRVRTSNLTQTMAEASRLYRRFLREVGKSVSI